MQSSEPSTNLSGTRLRAFIVALMVAQIAAVFASTMIYAAIKKLIQFYGDPATAGWLITIYMLVGAGTAALAGKLGDMYGRRRVIIVLLVSGLVGSLVGLMSTNFWVVLTARGLLGLTSAILPLGLGLIHQHIPAPKTSMAFGLVVTGSGIGSISGLVIGGMLVDIFTWQSIFLASGTLAAMALAMIITFVPALKITPSRQQVDLIGGVLFVPVVAGVLLLATNGAKWGWTSAPILGLAAASAALTAAWIWRSLSHPSPLLDIRLFARREILVANICMALLAIGTIQINQVLSLLLQQPAWTGIGLGVSATVAGLATIPSATVALTGGPLFAIIERRTGLRKTLVLAAALCTSGWCLTIMLHDALLAIIGLQTMIVLGSIMLFTALPNIVVRAVPVERASEATGMLMVARSAFMAIGAQLVALGLSYDTIGQPGAQNIRFPTEAAYTSIMGAIAATTAMFGIIVFFFLPRHKPPPGSES